MFCANQSPIRKSPRHLDTANLQGQHQSSPSLPGPLVNLLPQWHSPEESQMLFSSCDMPRRRAPKSVSEFIQELCLGKYNRPSTMPVLTWLYYLARGIHTPANSAALLAWSEDVAGVTKAHGAGPKGFSLYANPVGQVVDIRRIIWPPFSVFMSTETFPSTLRKG